MTARLDRSGVDTIEALKVAARRCGDEKYQALAGKVILDTRKMTSKHINWFRKAGFNPDDATTVISIALMRILVHLARDRRITPDDFGRLARNELIKARNTKVDK